MCSFYFTPKKKWREKSPTSKLRNQQHLHNKIAKSTIKFVHACEVCFPYWQVDSWLRLLSMLFIIKPHLISGVKIKQSNAREKAKIVKYYIDNSRGDGRENLQLCLKSFLFLSKVFSTSYESNKIYSYFPSIRTYNETKRKPLDFRQVSALNRLGLQART